jgi:hypothetical protein
MMGEEAKSWRAKSWERELMGAERLNHAQGPVNLLVSRRQGTPIGHNCLLLASSPMMLPFMILPSPHDFAPHDFAFSPMILPPHDSVSSSPGFAIGGADR